MQRGMSYRKPVPIYIPSPTTSPALFATELPHSFEHDSMTVDKQNVLRQTPIQPDIISTSNTAVNGTSLPREVSALNEKVPSLLVKSPEGEQIAIDESSYTPLTAPSCLPPSNRRRVKRKLHQNHLKQYRPPTPPLPSHTRKHRTPYIQDMLPVAGTPSSSIFDGNCESLSPELRRKSSTVAPSFITYNTQTPSVQTENTLIHFGSSGRSMFWSKKGDIGLHQLSKSNARSSRSGLTVVGHNEEDSGVPWWGKVSKWGASIGLKVKRFANMYMC